MVVHTSELEQAERARWVTQAADRVIVAAHVPASSPDAALAAARRLPLDDPRLQAARREWLLALEVLGLRGDDQPPGVCRRCGKVKSLHEISGGAGPCQRCLRRMQTRRRAS